MVIAAMKLRHLLLERKVMTNLDSIFKSRDISLPTKVHLVKAMVFPVVMYGWTLVGKVIALLLNMLSRLVTTFLSRSKCLNFLAAVTICSDFGAQKNKV